MIQTQTLKGFRDFLPEVAIKRQRVIEIIRTTFEGFGFDPLETPALEYAETLLGKYGDEADKLLYLFEDNGKRKVGLRYDQTVPLARVIAQYPELPLPFKRYQMQPVWRAENTQKGRYREFLQCDIDTIGTLSPLADAEIIICVLTVARNLGLPSPRIYINDRTIFDTLGLTPKEIIIIDKLDKIGKEQVETNLKEQIGEVSLGRFKRLAESTPTERLQTIMDSLKTSGFVEGKDFSFDPFLARGLDYYTSTIYELKDMAYSAGSLAGGGRYDNLIGSISGKDIPAVGVALGFDRLMDALEELNLISTEKTETQVLVTVFDPTMQEDAIIITKQLRDSGIATELYLDPEAKLEKQLKYADKKGIPYVVIQGSQEKEKGAVNIRNMRTREQKEVSLEEAVKFVK